jgi:hypothetical protein
LACCDGPGLPVVMALLVYWPLVLLGWAAAIVATVLQSASLLFMRLSVWLVKELVEGE